MSIFSPQEKKKYKKIENIGEGGFGKVIKAHEENNKNKVVAIKKMRANPLDIIDGINFTALREIKFLKHLKHPNLLNVKIQYFNLI
jgi:cyclin-dependent kinase 7